MTNKITARGLSVKLGKEEIIRNVDFEIGPNEIAILIGPNGSGKTTLMRALLGLTKIDQGSVKINGANNFEINPAQLAVQIGYLGQNVKPEWNMCVEDLVALARLPHQELGITTKSQDALAITDALKALNIEHLRNRKIETISGGELALVLLARVLAGKPKYIFADEPINHIDIAHQLRLVKALKNFCNGGGSVFAIIHDLSLAARLGTKFALMKSGEIIVQGDAAILNAKNLEEVFEVEIVSVKVDSKSIFFAK